ncbi:hypothetical protein EWI07_10550 [Sporolactobacillus sp. THM7-4]|nr:hypothetical protein EWI07_10550 [Sporolactobacillus sp. THM7-4]
MKDQEKIIHEKIIDNRRLGFLCLFLGVFLFLGTVAPTVADAQWKSGILSLTSLAFLLFAFFFHWRTAKLKEKIDK